MNEVNNKLTDLSTNFVYRADKKHLWDQYFVMKKTDGRYYGDCDDYSMTFAWFLCGGTLWGFIKAVLIFGLIRFYRVRTSTGGSHLVGMSKSTDEWFDNFSRSQLPRGKFFWVTGHHITGRQNRIFIAIYLLVGLFYRKR